MHVLILGQTGAGKTTLATRLSRDYLQAGVDSIVLDPFKDPRWPTPWVYDQDRIADFTRHWKHSAHGALFLDESGDVITQRRSDVTQQTATRARHWGHISHFLAQRAPQIPPNVRSQANRMALFNVTPTDAKTLYQEWGYPAVLDAPGLEVGQFFWMGRINQPPEAHFIDVSTGEVYALAREPDPSGSGARGHRGRGSGGHPSPQPAPVRTHPAAKTETGEGQAWQPRSSEPQRAGT